MRPDSIENSYIQNLDKPEFKNFGFEAEDAIIEFFQHIPDMDIRHSTESEDSGRNQIVQDQQLDAIAYLDGKPAMGLQITTASSPTIRKEKMKQIMNRPFIRLPEMSSSDTPIPRVLIYVDPSEVQQYSADHDFHNHPKLTDQILESALNCLNFDITKTANNLEKAAIAKLIKMLESEKKAQLN